MTSAGQRLAHYRILEKVGAGGMGEVYRALDEQLGREVAVKLLPSATFSDPAARARLVREAQTASKLNHQNICTIYEVGESEGHAFIVMEFVAGTTLADRLTTGPLSVDEAVRYGLQLTDALAHAHERGVVHRDLKSANIIVTPEGRTKVLDFGLAKQLRGEMLVDATTHMSLTAPGTVVGTVAYMAPEQLRGEAVDARSDVWAMGVVLYEMLAGAPPFRGRTHFELSSAILHEPAPRFRRDVPAALTMTIERCLDKEPAARYRDGSELRAAFEAIQVGAATLPVAIRSRLGRRRLAVLPLQNVSGDPEHDYLVDGTHEALITDLARIRALRVIARPSVMRYKGSETPLPDIAHALNVDAVMTGSVTRLGDRVRITMQLIDAETEEILWGGRYERGLRDVLSLQNEIVAAIAGEIETQLTPQEQARLAGARPVNPEAYEAYLKGRAHFYRFTPHDFDAALQYFNLALAKDPDYATAYAGIGEVWSGRIVWGLGPPIELWSHVKTAALKALELDETLPDAHYLMAGVLWNFDWDWNRAEAEYQRALDLKPNDPGGRLFYGHFLTAMRRFREATAQVEQAMALDPFNPFFQGLYAWHLMWVGCEEDAARQFRIALQTAPHFPLPRYGLCAIAWKNGRHEEALREVKAAFAALGDAEIEAALTRGYAEGGYERATNSAADALAARSRRTYVQPFYVAWLYDHAGRTDKAFEWLERSFQNRSHDMVYLSVHPLSAALRADPRFRDLLDRMNLPQS